MADAIKTVTVHTQQDDFIVNVPVVLEKLMDPAEVAEGDQWSFVDGGGTSLVIVRKRVTITEYPVEPPLEEEPEEVEPDPE